MMTPFPPNLRYERKFLAGRLSLAEVLALVRRHPALFREAYPPRSVNNIYLDSPALRDYHDHIQGVACRSKTRIRWYGSCGVSVERPVLERKIKQGAVGGKLSHPLPAMAWDAGAAWSFVNGGYFQIHSDLLFHNFKLFEVETGRMSLFYGPGARVKFGARDEFGDGGTVVSIRGVVGLAYEFQETPLELFIEVVPMLDIVPSTAANMAGAIGFRYYF